MKQFIITLITITFATLLVNCGGDSAKTSSANTLSGTVKIDGSSTVFPITEAVAEEFGKLYPKVRVTVGISGTGGGFKKYSIGETDINDASRPIKDKEIKKANENQIEFIELPVAYDGLSVVVNKNNSWLDYLTVNELHNIWKPGSQVHYWNDIRSNWPRKEIKLYGPGTDSGTFDYFTDAINGKSQSCRSDFTKSEDDNVLVQGVAGDTYALGFFGFAYYKENTDKLKIVPIDDGNGPISPSMESINNGTYSPLSRPIFIYVNPESLKRPEVDKFVEFYLAKTYKLSEEVGYVGLPESLTKDIQQKYKSRSTGKWYSQK